MFLNLLLNPIVCAWASSGTAIGTAPSAATKLLRFKSVIRIPFFRLRSSGFPGARMRGEYHMERLRLGPVIANIVDLAEHHHRVVFVDHVVTVQRDSPDEVAETEVHLRLHVVLQPENIFSTFRDQTST